MTVECIECGAKQTHRVCSACFEKSHDPTDVGTTRWWGRTWNAPVNIPEAQVAPPLGQPCSGRCGDKIVDGDRGLSIPAVETEALMTLAAAGAMVQVTYAHYHRECFMQMLGLPMLDPPA